MYFNYLYFNYFTTLSNSDDCDLHSKQFNVGDVKKALEKLKMGKASGFDGIVKEHLVYCHLSNYLSYASFQYDGYSLLCT